MIGLSVSLIKPDLHAQNHQNVLSDSATVDDCIRYAMHNQPLVRQLKIDEGIANQDIKIALADWLPQINSSANYQHYLKQPVSLFTNFLDPTGPKIPIPNGVLYNSGVQFSASQTIFNNDVYLAGKSARDYRQRSEQTTRGAMIDLVVSISKAYYDVKLSVEQLNIIGEEINRLNVSLKDAYALYQNGATDMIDYKRATISLKNATSQKKNAEEAIVAKMSYLKQLIGYPNDKPLNLSSRSEPVEKIAIIDTLQSVNAYNRIEYQLLQTNLKLQKSRLNYYRLGYAPTLSAFVNYNIAYQSDAMSELFKESYPNSAFGLSLNFPIFQGTKRIHNIRKAKLEYERLSLDTINVRNEINTQYTGAMSEYRSNLTEYRNTLDNIDIAQSVYNTVKLQYNQGIKNYLEVIVSETDLMLARINNVNALFMLMFSKIDVERAAGNIPVDY